MSIKDVLKYLSNTDLEQDLHHAQDSESLLKLKQLLHSKDKKTKALRDSFYKECRDRGLSDDPETIKRLLMQHMPSIGIADEIMLFLASNSNPDIAPYIAGGDSRPMLYEALIKNMGSLDGAQIKKNIRYLQNIYASFDLPEHETSLNALLSGLSGLVEKTARPAQGREISEVLGADGFLQQCRERLPIPSEEETLGSIDETPVVGMILKELEQFIAYTHPNNKALNAVLGEYQDKYRSLCSMDEVSEAMAIIEASTQLRRELSQKVLAQSQFFEHQQGPFKAFSKNVMQIIQAKADYARANIIYWKMPEEDRPQEAWEAYQEFIRNPDTSPIPQLENLYQQKKEQETYLKIDAAARTYLRTLDNVEEKNSLNMRANPSQLTPYVDAMQTAALAKAVPEARRAGEGISGFWNRRSRLEKIGMCIGGLLVVAGLSVLTGGAVLGFAALGTGIAGALTGAFAAIATAAGGGALGTAAAVASAVGVGLITTASIGGVAYASSVGLDKLSSAPVKQQEKPTKKEFKEFKAEPNQAAALASLSQNNGSTMEAQPTDSPKEVEQEEAPLLPASAPRSDKSADLVLPDDSDDEQQAAEHHPTRKGSFGG